MNKKMFVALAIVGVGSLLVGCSQDETSGVNANVEEMNKNTPTTAGSVPLDMMGPKVTSRGGAGSGSEDRSGKGGSGSGLSGSETPK